MKNAKFNIACASFGFLLSLVVGIITRASFGVLLLRAFIFALVFAAISFGLQIVFKTVLSTEEQSDSLSQPEDGGKPGSVVNITLQEEELPVENDAQRFFVGENHQMLNEDDYGHAINETVADAEHAGSPQHIDMTMDDEATEIDAASPRFASGGDSSSGNVAQQSAPQQTGFTAAPLQNVAKSSASGGSDNLPDISGLGEISGGSGAETNDTVASEPVEPVARSASVSRSSSASNISATVNVSDAALMAKAISTALASDSD